MCCRVTETPVPPSTLGSVDQCGTPIIQKKLIGPPDIMKSINEVIELTIQVEVRNWPYVCSSRSTACMIERIRGTRHREGDHSNYPGLDITVEDVLYTMSVTAVVLSVPKAVGDWSAGPGLTFRRECIENSIN